MKKAEMLERTHKQLAASENQTIEQLCLAWVVGNLLGWDYDDSSDWCYSLGYADGIICLVTTENRSKYQESFTVEAQKDGPCLLTLEVSIEGVLVTQSSKELVGEVVFR